MEVVKRSIERARKTVDTTAATTSVALAGGTVDTTAAPTSVALAGATVAAESKVLFTGSGDGYIRQETFVDLKNDATLQTFVSEFMDQHKSDIEKLKNNISDETVKQFANDIHKFVRKWNNHNSGPRIGKGSGYLSVLAPIDHNKWIPEGTEATYCFPLGLMVANPQLPVCRHRAMLVHAIVLNVLQNEDTLKGRIGTGHVTTGGHEYNVLVAKNKEGETFQYKIDAFYKYKPQKAKWTNSWERASASELLEFEKAYLPTP